MNRFLVDVVHIGNPTTWLYIGSAIFTVAGFSVRHMMALRALLIIASSLTMAANIRVGEPILWMGNLCLILLNTVQVVRLILDSKPIALPEDMKHLYRERFSTMTTREFSKWLSMGQRKRVAGEQLCTEGAIADRLYLLMAGVVEVRFQDHVVAKLGPGDMIGEMSFLSGRSYSANAVAVGEVDYVQWNQIQIAQLKQNSSTFYIKILAALGNDLVRKLQQERDTGATSDANSTLQGVGAVGWRPFRLV